MGDGLSLHLDLVRVCAAFLVVICHSFGTDISGGWLTLPMMGPDPVMIFFVLSGFVIAFTVEKKDKTLGQYICSRLARLWSVLIPALAVTVILDYLGLYLFPVFYHGWESVEQVSHWDNPIARILVAVTFTNELWFTSIRPLSNSPVWSLGFEFWYYAIFGAWYYLRGASRWILTAVCILICGPKIVLLMPVWILGVWTYRWLCSHSFSQRWGWVLFFAPLAIHLLLKATRPYNHTEVFVKRIFGEQLYEWLGFSHWFPYSFLIGILVAIHFAGAATVQKTLILWLSPFRRLIKDLSQHTLSFYLFHYPILLFTAAGLSFMHPGPLRTFLSIGITLTACFALGTVFENTRFTWRTWLAGIPVLTRLSQPANPLTTYQAGKTAEPAAGAQG